MGSLVKIRCLRQVIQSPLGARAMYIGFDTADNLRKVATAPSFQDTTTHEEIARNIQGQPVKDWQRPLDADREKLIANLFNNTGEFMPNPVLLCANPFSTTPLKVEQEDLGNGVQLETFLVDVPEGGGQKRPLWILDGQHRIAGLSKSKQKADPVPLVILLDHGGSQYTPDIFAKIFAQVTTSAVQLDPLHNAWLSYAFSLNDFAPHARASSAKRDSFETAATLCRLTAPGRFWDNVVFNPNPALTARSHLFRYDCIELTDLIQKTVFGKASVPTGLTSKVTADQIASAVDALFVVMPASGRKVNSLIGNVDHAQRYMQLGFLLGMMAVLQVSGPQSDWPQLLKDCGFDRKKWDLTHQALDFSGTAGTTSKRVATKVFRSVMLSRGLAGGTSVPSIMLGEGTQQTLIVDGTPYVVKEKTNTRVDVGSSTHVRLGRSTDSVGKVAVTRLGSQTSDVTARVRKGADFALSKGSEISIQVEMFHYGDVRSYGKLRLRRA